MSDTKESLPDITTIQPERLIKYRISEDRFSGEVLLPGLWYTDFDRKIGGKWTLSAMCDSLELVRNSILVPHGAFFMRDLTVDGLHLVFIASHKFSFEKEIHYIRRDGVWGYDKPYRFKAWLSGVGRSSYSVSQNMYDHNRGHILYASTTWFAYINRKTRKPCELPGWFIDKAKQFLEKNKLTPNHMLVKYSVPPIPDNALCNEIQALPSDCDANAHVNQSAYIRWCSDVGSLATSKKKYKFFTKDIGMYALKELAVQYIGETLVDETVEVNTWEDENEDRTLNFVITKNRKVIFHAKLKHYDKVMSML